MERTEASRQIRTVYYETRKSQQPFGDLIDDAAKHIPANWFGDAHSLVFHVLPDARRIAHRRIRTVIAALGDTLSQNGDEIGWCDTSAELADALSKLAVQRGFSPFLP